MADGSNIYRFDVSEYYFRLTTECIRLHSNERKKYSALSDVINFRAERALSVSAAHPPEYIREHLRLIPSTGEIPVEIEILQSSSDKINNGAESISAAIGSSIQFSDALSVIMFDFMVEANRTEILTKIGLTSAEASQYRKILKAMSPGVKEIN
ncbi:hypothetical protein [Novosphingobium sp. BL-52-GroH]|uniref:hypothetical protein n=1 Tax=Novosphingobium sp. BL-52-GroH TaxID=3349877 RepID=UPI00384B093F